MNFTLLVPVFLVLVYLPETSTFMDCRASCQKCDTGSATSVGLEIYCSLCKECRDRKHDGKVQSTEKDHEERPRIAGLLSRESPTQFQKLQGSPRWRPKPPMGLKGRIFSSKGRLLRPRAAFLNNHPLGKGDRLGKNVYTLLKLFHKYQLSDTG